MSTPTTPGSPQVSGSASDFHVMECIEGDECLVVAKPTFEEAETALLEYVNSPARASDDLSICNGMAGIVALWDPERGFRKVRSRKARG